MGLTLRLSSFTEEQRSNQSFSRVIVEKAICQFWILTMRQGEPVDPDSDKDTWELKRDLLMSMFFFDSDGTANTDCGH